MKVSVSSKNNQKVFENQNVINIGTSDNCHIKIDVPYDILISLQKNENGRWQIINNLKSNKVLFRGTPLPAILIIGNACKLMFAESDEFVGIKILAEVEMVERPTHSTKPKKTLSMIQAEDLNQQDIEAMYGNNPAVQTKIKIDKIKTDIDKRRAIINKEISYKVNNLRQKISQNEMLLSFLNAFIYIIPLVMAYVLKDLIIIGSNGLQSKILFLIAVGFIVLTFLLKQGQFLLSQNKNKKTNSQSSILVQRISLLCSYCIFGTVTIFSLAELFIKMHNLPSLIPQMLILCTFLCFILGVFAGFTKNIIAESAQELDSYESREDFQEVIKDYQQWIGLYINNFSGKKLRTISEKIFSLQIKSVAEYCLGIVTAPFLAYGVSQTLAECFPEAAGWIRLADGFKFSPIFLTLATVMICFAFHCFATSFATTKRISASNIIKRDGFSDYNTHGVLIHGIESSKNLKKEAKKFILIAIAVVAIEITMNVTYFIGVMGGDIQGMLVSFIAALVPTAILIAETTMLGNTKFDIIVKEELLEKVDKEY